MELYGAQRIKVLELLQAEGALDDASIKRVSEASGVPEADVYSVATFYTLLAKPDVEVRICTGLSCQMAGASKLRDDWVAQGKKVEGCACLGQCDRAPVALGKNRRLLEPIAQRGSLTPDNPDLVMNLAGDDDPGYDALKKAQERGADWVIEQVDASGLQGRGGAGFPAGFKWKAVRGQQEQERYVVCNADEGEPGTFKDREVMLRRPHLLLEGLAIAAFAIEAQLIIIYIRGEFMEERETLQDAIMQAGPALDGFDFKFVAGQGAYICGEETALLESLEGKRGMPRLKPPFPTEAGYLGKPTLMNNVETLACIPAILNRGGAWFKDQGKTEPGTKLYCISGHVQKPGIYELPLGVSLTELVDAAGGYLGTPRAFSPGGASSGFLPMSFEDQPLDFKGLASIGSMLGSAGVVVLNDTVDMAEAALWQAEFFEDESCGQCAPCRIGTRYLHQSIHRFIETGKTQTLRHIKEIGWEMDAGSICGLGIAAPLPILSAMRYFPEDFKSRE